MQSSTGILYCRFTLAVNRIYGAKNADFINCVAWRSQAENLAKYQRKGSLVGVVGSIQTGKYTGKDGSTKYTTDVVAHQIHFLGSRREQQEQDQAQYTDGYGYGYSQDYYTAPQPQQSTPASSPYDFISKQQQQQQQEIIEPDIQEYEIESYTVNNDDLPF
jgi:single-strand DNA-binding protein